MDRKRLAAVEVRVGAALEIEAMEVLRDQRSQFAQEQLLEHVRQGADALTNAVSDAAFERLFDNLASHIEAHPIDPELKEAKALIGARQRMAQRVRKLRSTCANQGSCRCRQGAANDLSGRRQGGCIAEVVQAADCMAALAKSAYAPYIDLQAHTLRIEAQSIGAHVKDGLLRVSHLSGHTNVQCEPNCSVVVVKLKDRHFDLRTMGQIVYVLAHELVCHAFQGLHGQQSRANADEQCCWSEGWMDEFAWTLLEAWLSPSNTAVPPWIRCYLFHVKDVCAELHAYRYDDQQSSLAPQFAKLRRRARRSFQHFLSAAAPAAEFTARLNLCQITPKVLEEITDMLWMGMSPRLLDVSEFAQKRSEAVVHSCNSFCKHNDPDRLLSDLRDSVFDVVQ